MVTSLATRRAITLVVVAACRTAPDDCAIVRDHPADAMAVLSQRHPNSPVQVAETIERCIAPDGDDCDRIAKIIATLPAMAPQLAMPKPFDYAKTCRAAPPEFRRCLLPSYTLAHADECHRAMSAPLTSIDIVPKDSTRTQPSDCGGFVSIYIDKRGTWLATGRDATSRCFAPRKAGALDRGWLETQLRKVVAIDCPAGSAELASADDVRYQEVIDTMDVAVKVGIVDVGLSPAAALAVPLGAATPLDRPSECPATVITPAASEIGSAVADRAARGSNGLANAPVLIITATALSLKTGETTTELGTIAQAQAGAGNLDALTRALPPSRDGLLILQADASTPATVINRVVMTSKAAGYDNVLFAVKNR